MERMLQKPFTDPNRSVIIQQALIRAYESGCRDEIYAAAKDAQKYVDEVMLAISKPIIPPNRNLFLFERNLYLK